jgi:hypothetical protein
MRDHGRRRILDAHLAAVVPDERRASVHVGEWCACARYALHARTHADHSRAQSTTLPTGTGYNTAMRGYPDVAVAGHDFVIVLAGQMAYVDGTSASGTCNVCAMRSVGDGARGVAPTFAGMVSLVNAMRVRNGLSTLGFLNPVSELLSLDSLSECCFFAFVRQALYAMGNAGSSAYYHDVTSGMTCVCCDELCALMPCVRHLRSEQLLVGRRHAVLQ